MALVEYQGSATGGGQTSTPVSPTNPLPVVLESGTGLQNVNVSQLNGAPPSLTNPIFIANAEAGDTTGTFTNATQTTSLTATNCDGYATALVSINGTYGAASAVFEASDDSGTTWYSVAGIQSDDSAIVTGYTALTNTNRQWSFPISGNDSFRVRSTAVASGTVNVRISITAIPTLPPGAIITGSVTVASSGASSAVSLTRTNDTNAYTANDVIGAATGSTAALTFALNAGQFMLTSVSLEVDIAAVVSGMTSFNLELYNVTPPSALGDNAAWDLPSGDRASYLGVINLGTPVDLGSTLYVSTAQVNQQIKIAAGGSLFGYLTTVGGWTPAASTVFVITLYGLSL